MWWARAIGVVVFSFLLPARSVPSSARSIHERLMEQTIDAEQIYKVRDLYLDRGGVKMYLNEGVLAFATPVAGRVVAAVFTTHNIEAGDAEVLAFPPNRSERTSLASYTKTPVLNEHFGIAAFFFSDNTLQDCLAQLHNPASHRVPELAAQLRPELDPILHNLYSNFSLNLVEALLDHHETERGFFYGTFGGRDLGAFNLLFDPTNTESVTIGQVDKKLDKFKLWTSFRASHTPPQVARSSRFSNYRIHGRISDSLRFSARADFQYRCDVADGRSLRFELSERLGVTAAFIDGEPVEVFERKTIAREQGQGGSFLLISREALTRGPHEISVSYEGELIRHTNERTYFVEERATWYPHAQTTAAVFDLTFECPGSLQLVATGELLSDVTEKGIRTVHRRTPVSENVAGFNLGEYHESSAEAPPYHVNVFSNPSREGTEDLAFKTASILQTYSQWWSTLPYHSVAVSPISGYFGQGFPGLIYLSDVSYLRKDNRPSGLRNPRMDSFFSDTLLPHEVAHQWWGNIVVPADYRAGWLSEAMATHSALEYLGQHSGEGARASVLNQYKNDLCMLQEGKSIESLGPVDFGARLIDAVGKEAWQAIEYEKGAWVLRMLQTRLGEQRWLELQANLLKDFNLRPLTNDAFRQSAARLLPPGQPDRDLQLFFETWVYSTGLPRLALSRHAAGWELEVSGVESDFTADIPIDCRSKSSKEEGVRWIRATVGTNFLPSSESNQVCHLPAPDRFLYVQ